MEGAVEGDGDGAREDYGEGSGAKITREGFFKRPPRPHGTKTAKAEATLQAKRECTL